MSSARKAAGLVRFSPTSIFRKIEDMLFPQLPTSRLRQQKRLRPENRFFRRSGDFRAAATSPRIVAKWCADFMAQSLPDAFDSLTDPVGAFHAGVRPSQQRRSTFHACEPNPILNPFVSRLQIERPAMPEQANLHFG